MKFIIQVYPTELWPKASDDFIKDCKEIYGIDAQKLIDAVNEYGPNKGVRIIKVAD